MAKDLPTRTQGPKRPPGDEPSDGALYEEFSEYLERIARSFVTPLREGLGKESDRVFAKLDRARSELDDYRRAVEAERKDLHQTLRAEHKQLLAMIEDIQEEIALRQRRTRWMVVGLILAVLLDLGVALWPWVGA